MHFHISSKYTSTAGRRAMLSYGFAVNKQIFFLQVNTRIL